MGRGIFVGLIWGILASIVVIGVLSLNAPLPPRPEQRVDSPRPSAIFFPSSPPAQAPSSDADQPAPAPDTPAARPEAGIPLPAGSEFNRPPEEAVAVVPGTEAAPAIVTPGATPASGGDTAPPAPDTSPAPQPQATAVLEGPGAPSAEVSANGVAGAGVQAPAAQILPAPLGLPQIETDPGALVGPADPDATRASRLPTVGQSAETPDAPLPAIRANAAAFDEAETRPLLSIVLIDDPSFPLGREVLTRFDFPVAFAIDPARADAAEAAAAYRAAGFEVVILADALPEGAQATDVEVAMEAAFALLPQAVAVLDTPDQAIQSDRTVLTSLIAVLEASGHGLIAYPRGLNTAVQQATRASVPAATIFRVIDDEAERATVITRFLDRAAFAAQQDGAVIVVGHTYAETVTALFSWALGSRSESVALAPVSAALQR